MLRPLLAVNVTALRKSDEADFCVWSVRWYEEPLAPESRSLEVRYLESSPELQHSLPKRLSTSVSENASELTEQSSPIVDPGGDE